jgi:hypothetical protein
LAAPHTGKRTWNGAEFADGQLLNGLLNGLFAIELTTVIERARKFIDDRPQDDFSSRVSSGSIAAPTKILAMREPST